MTNREAIEYASKHSFLELYNLGKAAGREELISECGEDIDDIPFPSQLLREVSDRLALKEQKK